MKNERIIRIGTRGSRLAMAQSLQIAAELRTRGYATTIIEIKTLGDKLLSGALSPDRGRGKSFFVKEIEDALLANKVDLAVHSLKDLPPLLPKGLVLGAITKREDPHDAYLSLRGKKLCDERPHAVIGSSSPRRVAQLQRRFPGFRFEILRGNVETRIRKMKELKLDGIVLAWAGLKRLGLQKEAVQKIPFSIMLPAAGQGALGIECRADDRYVRHAARTLEDPRTRVECDAERFLLTHLEGGCQAPIGVCAKLHGKTLVLSSIIASVDGLTHVADAVRCDSSLWKRAVRRLAARMLAAGGEAIIQSIRS